MSRVLNAIMLVAGVAATPVTAATDASFATCAACHSIKAGQMGMGPALNGIVGRAKASVVGYAYSPAMKAQKGAWTERALDAYLKNPKLAVPGTKMAYPGIADDAARARTVAYLKTLR